MEDKLITNEGHASSVMDSNMSSNVKSLWIDKNVLLLSFEIHVV